MSLIDYKVVRVIIERSDNKILLLKRPEHSFEGGRWCLPGGKHESFDSLEQTAVAEVREETGLTINQLTRLFQIDISHYFHTKSSKKTVQLNNESTAFEWVAPNNINSYDIAFRNDIAINRWYRKK